MRQREHFPHKVKDIETIWIKLSDGCRLAARLWLPENAEAEPVPAILEYLPYRRRDGTLPRDEMGHPYVAGHGYACIRVDMRGTGDSDGLLADEYTQQELTDALDVVDWLSKQSWCSGKVGMMGISWGGFNSLQVAALKPKALKAIITVCSTADRYETDIHYKGGAENTGTQAGEFCIIWLGPEWSLDQKADDANSACFDLKLEHPLDLVGAAVLNLKLKSQNP